MLFSKRALFLAGALSHLASAIPAPDVPADLVVLEQFETEHGTATWYGSAGPEKRAPVDLERRCGSNAVTCSGSHQGSASTCAQLIVSIVGPRAQTPIPASPRSFCLSGSGGNCCVSWSQVVNNAVYGDLVSAAKAVNNQCQSNGKVSGLARDVLVGSTCTTQCLSDRPNGCS
ncbi:hypothetical protein QQS21_007708 [Conoideocrella luteorostrata]|uniref:WD-like domain-containing protein n=1 Tax=Conoideocrella luteorostrata TaxID=1105319 RepID=A0AAJ0CK78_9HYPO|nr:hypothetical protein QQS21_007708 [Conoideocrella luteorostrata]